MKRFMLLKILQKVSKKFGQIKKIFQEVSQYIESRYKTKYPISHKRTLFIQSLPKLDPNSSQFNRSRIEFIEHQKLKVNNHLLTSTSSVINTLHIYEEEDQLIINCLIINDSTYLDYMQETKEQIIIQLIEITNKIIQ